MTPTLQERAQQRITGRMKAPNCPLVEDVCSLTALLAQVEAQARLDCANEIEKPYPTDIFTPLNSVESEACHRAEDGRKVGGRGSSRHAGGSNA